MSDWSLTVLLASLHNDIERRLQAAREAFGHPVTKGDASEHVWLGLSPPRVCMLHLKLNRSIDADEVSYAQKKVASVRRLHRTSLPIPHAGGTYPAKTPAHILGGLLAFESEWTPPLGQPLTEALGKGEPDGRLDLGCVAAHGMFGCDEKDCYTITPQGKPATAFLFELIARLQSTATVPMIDIRAYARWLAS